MPVKFFSRRKSAGNALETYNSQPSGSFRVLDRDEIADRRAAADAAAAKEKEESRRFSLRRLSVGRPLSSPTLLNKEEPFQYSSRGSDRASGRTNNSSSTTTSSTRFSYISTNPSSVDSIHDFDNRPFAKSSKYPRQGSPPVPLQPRSSPAPQIYSEPDEDDGELFGPPFTLKAAGRTFSFGSRVEALDSSEVSRSVQETPRVDRERAATTSSYASTTTPQNVNRGNLMPWDESDFGLGGLNLTSEGRRLPDLPTPPAPIARKDSDSMLEAKSAFPFHSQNQPIPLSNHLEKSPPPHQSFSPRSFDSRGSQDAFLPGDDSRRPSPAPASFDRRPESLSRRDSSSSVEPDEQLVLDAVYAIEALDYEHGQPAPASHPLPEPPRLDNQYLSPTPPRTASRSPPSAAGKSSTETPRAQTMSGMRELSDERRSYSSSPAQRRPLPRPGMAGTNKVMTPEEFARLRNQQNVEPDYDSASEKSDDEEPDEDEDETERARQAAKQRKRQEAHLAVYRQQMMKVTGEKTSDLPRPDMRRAAQSTPNLFSDSPALDLKLGSNGNEKISDDSDEDIPLGVLQAHGFPSKGRPPNRLSGSNPTTPGARSASQMSSYPAPPGSTRNDPSAGGGGGPGLPAFARHFPQDPYVGASLVNATNREAPSQQHASNAQGGQPTGPLPPGGLVGVIAGEERARAQRRGSPNTEGTYGRTPSYGAQPQMPPHGAMPGMGGMPHQQRPMSPGEQSQVDMSNSMAQMMQMQMQWMQQMMQMNGMQTPPQMQGGMPMSPQMMQQMQANGMQMPPQMMQQMQMGQQQYGQNHLAPPQQQVRPDSLLSQASGNQHARRMSMMSQAAPRHNYPTGFGNNGLMAPSTASVYQMQPPNAGYTPSIAPTERSTIGQPSRYRPVTMGSSSDGNKNSRTSTMSLSMNAQQQQQQPLPGLNINRSRSPPKGPLQPIQNLPSTVRVFSKPKHGAGSDDEDDEGWAALKKKREARMAKLREKKAMPPLNPTEGLEALYYDD